MDEAEIDLGNFIAHLELEALRGRLTPCQVAEASEAFLEGYVSVTGSLHPTRVRIHTAAALFRLLPRPFRSRVPDWPEQTQAILNRAESLASDDAGRRPPAMPHGPEAVSISQRPIRCPRGSVASDARGGGESRKRRARIREALEMSVAVRSTASSGTKRGAAVSSRMRRRDARRDVHLDWQNARPRHAIANRACAGCARTIRLPIARAKRVSVPHVIGCVAPLHVWLRKWWDEAPPNCWRKTPAAVSRLTPSAQ